MVAASFCTSSAFPLGAYRIPPGAGLLIPSLSEVDKSLLGLNRVVALARLHLQVLVGGADLKFTERTVLFRIGGRVTDRVLAAHLFLNLAEDVVERGLAVHLEHAPASVVGHAAQHSLAAPAPQVDGAEAAAVRARIFIIDAVNDRVGLLRVLDGLLLGQTAA